MILLDTSGVLAWIDGSQTYHRAVVEAMSAVEAPFILSPFVLAELDYLLATRVGGAAQRALLDEVASGAYSLIQFGSNDVGLCLSVIDRFADQAVGLADASLVVLANRFRVGEVLTLDQRHFRVLTRDDGQPFRILPSDHY